MLSKSISAVFSEKCKQIWEILRYNRWLQAGPAWRPTRFKVGFLAGYSCCDINRLSQNVVIAMENRNLLLDRVPPNGRPTARPQRNGVRFCGDNIPCSVEIPFPPCKFFEVSNVFSLKHCDTSTFAAQEDFNVFETKQKEKGRLSLKQASIGQVRFGLRKLWSRSFISVFKYDLKATSV